MKHSINRKLYPLRARLTAGLSRFLGDDRGDPNSTSIAGWVIVIIVLLGVVIAFLLPFVRNDLLPLLAQRIKDLFNVTA